MSRQGHGLAPEARAWLKATGFTVADEALWQEALTHGSTGEARTYERLEFLGDCFLKMATSISLFAMNPDNNEYDFHVKRMLLICNQNLFNNAIPLEIFKFIRSRSFSR